MMELVWNGISSTAIPEFSCLKITRQLLGGYRGTSVAVPGRPGAWHFPEQRGRRLLTMECAVLVEEFPTDRRDALTAVADWLDINTEAPLVCGDEPEVYYSAVLLEPPDVNEWRQLGGVFELQFECDPYSYDLNSSLEEFTQNIDDEWSHNFGLLVPTYPVIEITNNGPNNIEGLFFKIQGITINVTATLAVGEVMTINSLGMAVTGVANDDVNLTGYYDPTLLTMSGVYGEFPILVPGVNNFEIEAEQVSEVLVRIFYRKRYRR